MSFERRELQNVACPCAKGRLRIDFTYEDTDWGIRDQDWEADFTCAECREGYRVVRAGRGVDVISAKDFQLRNELILQAASEINSALRSEKVAAAIESFIFEIEACRTVAAQYRLMHDLKIETATLPTFRKHIRDQPVRKWLGWKVPIERDQERSLRHIIAICDFLTVDSTALRDAILRADALKEQAIAAQHNAVMSLGPITLIATFGGRTA